jgi:hypothetical protein
MMEPKKLKIKITVAGHIFPDEWDDDVDWSDPKKVLYEYIECVGLSEFILQTLSTDDFALEVVK